MLPKKIKYRGYLLIVGLIALSFIPLFDLFKSGLPLTHDGQDHVARIANFYKNLQEGNIIPRWAANLNWGYGHPILVFLYPLPSYLASLFHLVGFSLVDSTKIVFGLGFVASGLTMYIWLKEFLGTKSAFVGAILYMFAPYRFVDLYVRGAIGEHIAFVFPPLILYFLLMSAKKSSYWFIAGGGFSLCGLILSHNAMSLMFVPIIVLYVLYLYFQATIKKEFLIATVFIIFFGFSLAAFFWVPALLEGKYTLRDKVVSGEYANRFIPFNNFFHDPPTYNGYIPFSMKVGIVQWVVVFVSHPVTYYLYKRKKIICVMNVVLLCMFVISLFLITNASRLVWEIVSILQNFQFPWRFLSLIVFITALLGGILFSLLPKKLMSLAVLLVTVGTLYFTNTMWHVHEFLDKPEVFFTDVYDSTTDTGESAPIWSVRFMEKRPKAHIEVIDGKATTKELIRTSTKHTYKVYVAKKTRFRENTLYFPGWNIFVDAKQVDIEFQDPANRGLMTFYVDRGKHFISVEFKETKLRTVANAISVVSLVFLIIYGILNKRLIWKHSR